MTNERNVKHSRPKVNEHTELDTDIDLNEIDDFLDAKCKEENKQAEEGPTMKKLFYKLKDKSKEFPIKEVNEKMKCPICGTLVKNIQLHFKRNSQCAANIDNVHFQAIYSEFSKQQKKERDRQRKHNSRDKKRNESQESHIKLKEQNRRDNQNLRYRKKNESEEAHLKLKANNRRDIQNFRDRKKNESEESYQKLKEQNRKDNQNHRERRILNITKKERIANFKRAVLFGPIFICSCCSRKLFENGVTLITAKFRDKINEKKADHYNLCIPHETVVNIIFNGNTDKTGSYICYTCKTTMISGKIPSMSIINGLKVACIDESCHLTELENNLIAQNINFQYIFFLPTSRWAATKKQMISVPVRPETVLNTMNQLPRIPKEAGLIPVKLKRKLEYEGCHKKEFVDPHKILRTLNYLKRSGHPDYQFFDNLEEYEKRCKDQDENGHDLLFGNTDIKYPNDKNDSCSTSKEISKDDDSDENEDEMEINYITKDPVRKHQFDHNRNTCLTNNYPEMFVDENENRVATTEQLSFAPAEGNTPTNILNERNWDIKGWPVLHPDGLYGLHHKRKVRLTDQQFFVQRILNQDLRFANSPGYIFAAAAYIEQKQLASRANI